MDMTVGMERTVVAAAVGTADLSNAHGWEVMVAKEGVAEDGSFSS